MDPRDKKFKIPGHQIKRLIPNMGACFASDRITVDGAPVGYMYREQPDNGIDSGWRFFAGDEPEEYIDHPDNLAIYDVNTICNYDPAIIPFLDAPVDSSFSRIPGTDKFQAEQFDKPDEGT